MNWVQTFKAVGEETIESLQFPDWLLPSSPFILAVIAGVVTLIVRKIRGPVAVQDLWAENRLLRKEMSEIRAEVDLLRQAYEKEKKEQGIVNRTMGDGFVALSGYVQRTNLGKTKPAFTPDEEHAIEAAKALLGDDIWATVPGLS